MTDLRSWRDVHRDQTLEEVASRYGSSVLDYTPPQGGTLEAPAAAASVNSGRWIVACPFCSGAEYVNFDDLRFFCCECRNAKVDHHPLRVVVPAGTAQIAAVLIGRPDVSTRNWLPPETVDDLERENKENG